MSCGDKISSCRGSASWKTCTHRLENLHPQLQENPGSEPVEDQMPVCLVATRFHLVEGKCKLKTCTHKKARASLLFFYFLLLLSPLLWRHDSIVSLVATRFHLVSCGDKISSCRRHVQVENSHPHGKTCSPPLLWRQDFILSKASAS